MLYALLSLVSLFALYLLIELNNYKNNSHIKEHNLTIKVQELNQRLSIIASDYSELNQNYYNSLGELKTKTEEMSSLKNKLCILDSDLENLKVTHKADLDSAIQTARKDALKRSRSVLRGQASEHLAPFVIEDTNPKDYRFMGNPVDYICFDGLSDVLDGQSDSIKTVRFVDIKTGKSNLNKSQRRIRDAIKDGRVTFEIVNLDEVMKIDKTLKELEAESTKES
jgi:predicted Holliday junction resolvase-like endonuclease